MSVPPSALPAPATSPLTPAEEQRILRHTSRVMVMTRAYATFHQETIELFQTIRRFPKFNRNMFQFHQRSRRRLIRRLFRELEHPTNNFEPLPPLDTVHPELSVEERVLNLMRMRDDLVGLCYVLIRIWEKVDRAWETADGRGMLRALREWAEFNVAIMQLEARDGGAAWVFLSEEVEGEESAGGTSQPAGI